MYRLSQAGISYHFPHFLTRSLMLQSGCHVIGRRKTERVSYASLPDLLFCFGGQQAWWGSDYNGRPSPINCKEKLYGIYFLRGPKNPIMNTFLFWMREHFVNRYQTSLCLPHKLQILKSQREHRFAWQPKSGSLTTTFWGVLDYAGWLIG